MGWLLLSETSWERRRNYAKQTDAQQCEKHRTVIFKEGVLTTFCKIKRRCVDALTKAEQITNVSHKHWSSQWGCGRRAARGSSKQQHVPGQQTGWVREWPSTRAAGAPVPLTNRYRRCIPVVLWRMKWMIGVEGYEGRPWDSWSTTNTW